MLSLTQLKPRFTTRASQETLYDSELQTLLDQVTQGFNATLFCYGVTGSGKTHTINGLLPRAIAACLALPDHSTDLSYFQILNERLQDLLSEEEECAELQIREKDGEVLIPGATEVRLQSQEHFDELQQAALSRRATAHTKSNTASSRSHAVLRLRLSTAKVTGVLNLIDLAGSEDNRVTGEECERG